MIFAQRDGQQQAMLFDSKSRSALFMHLVRSGGRACNEYARHLAYSKPQSWHLAALRAPKVHILVQAWDSPHEGEPVISDIKCFHQLSSFIILVKESTGVHRSPECIMCRFEVAEMAGRRYQL